MEKDQKEFSEELFQKELEWLKRKEEGKIIESITPGSWMFVIGTALFIGFFIGGSVGALFGGFFGSFRIFVIPPLATFLLVLFFLNRTYSVVQIDPSTRELKYVGNVSFAGEEKHITYHGPIEVISGSQLVKHSRYGKIYLRFVTSAGYLRMNYKPVEEPSFLVALESMGLVNLNQMDENLRSNKVIRKVENWLVYYEDTFDRTEFLKKLKEDHLKKEEDAENQRQAERDARIARTKERLKRKQSSDA